MNQDIQRRMAELKNDRIRTRAELEAARDRRLHYDCLVDQLEGELTLIEEVIADTEAKGRE